MEKTEQEFTCLIEKYKSTIYAVCFMFSKNRDEIDDMFQEILIKLWSGYERFRGESDAKTWIYRVSLNCCLNQQKRKRREPDHIALSIDIDPFEGISDRSLQTKRLYERINHLGLIDRAIILLWLEGMTYEEIGAIIGISVKNVSFQLSRIREKLKNAND